MIPQSSPQASYIQYKSEIDSAISRVLESGWYVLGKECQSFEKEFAEYNQACYALGVGSGTDALEISLRVLGIKPGDEVVTVSHTAVATVSAISRIGATPLFVDIADNYTLDPEQLRILLNQKARKIKAIIAVHIYGQPADMEAILSIAELFGIPVVEDCAQAHGAMINSKKVGSLGLLGCFSFYPTKNLGALGDGGMIITDDKELYEKACLIRQYGWKERYVSIIEGVNSRLDELQAAILRIKLSYLDESIQKRKEIAQYYTSNLPDEHLKLPFLDSKTEHVFHQYVVKSDCRERLQKELQIKAISTAIHYPKAVHQQAAYNSISYRPLPLKNTELFGGQIVSLPMYPQLSENEINKVCSTINSFFDKSQ